jgi:hypothetical protein
MQLTAELPTSRLWFDSPSVIPNHKHSVKLTETSASGASGILTGVNVKKAQRRGLKQC